MRELLVAYLMSLHFGNDFVFSTRHRHDCRRTRRPPVSTHSPARRYASMSAEVMPEEGFTWERALGELERRARAARELGGVERIERRRAQGFGTVRERIARVTDRFYEIGEFARFIERDADGNQIEDLPSSYVCGLGEVDGRPVAVGGEDFTVRGGVPGLTYLDRMKGGMGGFVEDLAHEYRIPLLIFNDGIGGDAAAIDDKGHAYLVSSMSWRRIYEVMSEVPVVTAVLGGAAGGSGG